MSFFRDSDAHDRIEELIRRAGTLEALVERLAVQAGLSPHELEAIRDTADPGLTPEVRRLVGESQLIHAIKEYRKVTGAGLVEAKRAIDEYAARGNDY